MWKEKADKQSFIILYFVTFELVTALLMCQFNIATVALILLSYKFAEENKYCGAAFLLCLGTFVKLYGIVGIVFILLCKHPKKFLLWTLFWNLAMFCFPMLFHGISYVVGQYNEWFNSILTKDADNVINLTTNVSLQGLLLRFFGVPYYICKYSILIGIISLCVALSRHNQWRNENYRISILAVLLIDIVLFSSSSENSTYIISAVGCIIWYTTSTGKRSILDKSLLLLMFTISLLSPSLPIHSKLKLFYIQPYALKALPLTLIWVKLSAELMIRRYADIKAI